MATFKTRKIAVVGAGNLGSHCAFALALQGACEQIVFVDSNYPRAQAQAQDLEDTMTAMPHAVQVWAGSYSDCVDANLVLFCGGSFPKDCESPQNAWEASMRAADQLIPVLRDGGFKGVLVVAGCAPQAVRHDLSVTHRGTLHRALKAMTAPESDDIIVTMGEIQAGGEGFF